MKNKNVGSLFGLPFFKDLMDSEIKRIEAEIKKVNNESKINDLYFYSDIINNTKFYNDDYTKYSLDEDIIQVVKKELANYCLEIGIVSYFFEEQEANKIKISIQNNQYNSKLVKSLLNKFVTLSSRNSCIITCELANILQRSLNKGINDVIDQKTIKLYKPLKEVVDKITSGVSSKCYLELKNSFLGVDVLSTEINKYIIEKYHYDFNRYNTRFRYLVIKDNDTYAINLLSKALVDDDSFWLEGYNKIGEFLYLVHKYNGMNHAAKIVDYIFENLLKNETIKCLINNSFPLSFSSEKVKDALIERTIKYTYERFNGLFSFDFTKDEKDNLFYPLRDNNALEGIIKGKETFINFLKEAYPSDYLEIIKIFNDTNTIIQEGDQDRKRKLSLGIMLESPMFGYISVGEERDGSNLEREYFYDYNNFGTNESILNRFYYRVYLLNKYSNEATNAALYEILYDTLNMINKKYNYKCSFIYNYDMRNKKYNELKEILNSYGFKINDCNKFNYIVALLDRKTATEEESKHFSELEELGDAVYELAVKNILFYHKDVDDELKYINNNFDNLVSAKNQIKVAEKIGIDKLYISSIYQIGIHMKYDVNDDDFFIHINSNYIADSLEMIIGAILKEFGVQRALDFATKIIVEANDDYNLPEIIEYNEELIYKGEYDYWYYRRIFPSPLDRNNDYYDEAVYKSLEKSLIKLIKLVVIGNETIKKRVQTLSYDSSDLLQSMHVSGYTLTCYYLHYKIEKTIDFYKDMIIESYNKINKE